MNLSRVSFELMISILVNPAIELHLLYISSKFFNLVGKKEKNEKYYRIIFNLNRTTDLDFQSFAKKKKKEIRSMEPIVHPKIISKIRSISPR